MKPSSKNQGLTLVEMLVGIVAASILALTAGTMLVCSWRECRRDSDGMGMQQDGRVAMETIARTVRAASTTGVNVASASDLRVTVTGVTKRVYASGLNLVYDPNTAVAGDTLCLVTNCLSSFAVAITNAGGVAVTLTMVAGDNTHHETVKGVFTCRN